MRNAEFATLKISRKLLKSVVKFQANFCEFAIVCANYEPGSKNHFDINLKRCNDITV